MKCEGCGCELHEETMSFMGINRTFQIGCRCEELRQQEQARIYQARIVNLRTADSGLKARQREMTFDNFAATPKQAEALAACRELASGSETSLLLCGGVGCGKTHLACAAANELIIGTPFSEEDMRNARLGFFDEIRSPVMFVSAVELLEQIRSGYSDGSSAEVMGRCKNARVLIIDDLGAEKSSEWVSERFFEIVDHRYNEYRPLLITTNLTAAELTGKLGARTADRLRAMCRLINITEGSMRHTAGKQGGH